MEGTTFVIAWDMTGLECVINATEVQGENIMRRLRDEPGDALRDILNMLVLRARANSQRYYEIYSITTEQSITEDDLVNLFKENPQGAAELIRSRGKKLYGNGAGKTFQVIK